jgi:hypothetical protein
MLVVHIIAIPSHLRILGRRPSASPLATYLSAFVCSHKHPISFSALPVLDPNVKDLYCHHQWEPGQYAAGMVRLEEVVSLFPFSYHVIIAMQYLFNSLSISLMSTMFLQKPCLSHHNMKPTMAKVHTISFIRLKLFLSQC